MSPEVTNMIITSLVAALGVLLPLWKVYSTRKAVFDVAVKAATFAVTEVAKRTNNTVDDKFALFLQVLSGSLEAKGQKISTEDARAVFEKLQGVK